MPLNRSSLKFALGFALYLATTSSALAECKESWVKQKVESSEFRFKEEHASVLHCVRR